MSAMVMGSGTALAAAFPAIAAVNGASVSPLVVTGCRQQRQAQALRW